MEYIIIKQLNKRRKKVTKQIGLFLTFDGHEI